VWIERTDYEETPPKGFFRLFPGNKVRLKYGYVIECTGRYKRRSGQENVVRANLIKTPNPAPRRRQRQGQGRHHLGGRGRWRARHRRLYDRLFTEEQPDAGGRDFLGVLNPHSLHTVQAVVEPSLAAAQPRTAFSSSATASSSPTGASIRRAAGWCSTASRA
jgi:glutaminyl-tRNA synthetase